MLKHRNRLIAAAGAAATAAAIAVTGIGVASAATGAPAAITATGRPTVHEQQAINQNVAIATGNVHTTLTTSPVLAPGNYLVAPPRSRQAQLLLGWPVSQSSLGPPAAGSAMP